MKKFFDSKNLILVDFKLEFGRYKGKIILADEISPDTCRLWDKTTKEKLVTLGKTVMYEILGPLASLGIGAIVKFWIMKGM